LKAGGVITSFIRGKEIAR
jgi:hypothetical protein